GHFTYESGTTVTEKTQFDLASMTKVIVTTTAIMQLYESGAIKLDDPVARYLPAFGANGKQDVTIRQLLQHRGGLIPYRRYHMNGYSTRQSVIDAIMTDSLVYEPGTETRYSDLGMITLGLLVERVSGLSLADYADRRILRPLGMINSGFKPVGAGGDPLAVPTEVDSTFRMKLIQGEVHDETAYLLGGASGHAGLFSTAEDLARFADMMLHEGMIDGKRFLKASTIKLFTMRSDDISARDRALGWDLKSPDGYSSAGKYFGPNSFGHTGFTGTSIWIDPDAKLFAILLTNRVYPTRDNRSIVTIRPQFADLAFAAIEGAAEPKLPLPPH
ncbi:MAG: beta-lactamase family protein, partial [Bacteroidetes bacterium]|nr:beta-lactamase family protein [Bacteroidota bacterium]